VSENIFTCVKISSCFRLWCFGFFFYYAKLKSSPETEVACRLHFPVLWMCDLGRKSWDPNQNSKTGKHLESESAAINSRFFQDVMFIYFYNLDFLKL